MESRRANAQGRTVALLDIDSASVGIALASISSGDPRLFAEKRTYFDISRSLHGQTLLNKTQQFSQDALIHASEVSARLRTYPQTKRMGEVSQVVVFLQPPWTTTDLSNTTQHTTTHAPLAEDLRGYVRTFFNDIPVNFRAFGPSVTDVLHTFIPEGTYVLCIITGELTELLLVHDAGILGHASFPSGFYTALRTLMTHAGISSAEARSVFKLDPAHMQEPLGSMRAHFVHHFSDAARSIVQKHLPHTLYVIAPEPYGDWFARAAAEAPGLSEYFGERGEVRALSTTHFSPLLAAHAQQPDLLFILEALFVHQQQRV